MVVTEPAVRLVAVVKLVADEVALVELVALLIAVARSASVSLAPPLTMLIVAACPEWW
jgi:site-specific recombinase